MAKFVNGTATLFKDDHKLLRPATKEIYRGDKYMNCLAETTVNIEAREEEDA